MNARPANVDVDGALLVGRADATPSDGAGHVARTLSVLEAWCERGGAAQLWSHDLQPFWRARATQFAIDVVEPPPAEQLAPALVAAGAAAVVVDGYRFDDALVASLADVLVTVRVDDFVRRPPRCHVFVDPNLERTPRSAVPAGTRVLEGPAHALLRSEFRARVDSSGARDGALGPRVLVAFGSSDPARLTVPCVDALLARRGNDVEIDVVAGPALAAPDRAELARLAAADVRGLRVLFEVSDMVAVLAGVDVGLIAGGTTIFELLATGVVPVAVQVVDNQRRSSGGLGASGLGVDLGWHADLAPRTIAERVLDLAADRERVAELARAGRAAVDARGALRVVDATLAAIAAAGSSDIRARP